MPRTLIRKNPSNFKTLPLYVEATPEGLSYQSVGMPLNFAQTLQRRRPVNVADAERFALELANLGVSVRLTLRWQHRDYWVLVRQRRQDRGDVVLKLISGYVPAHELNLPLHTAIQEIAEECLLETPEGWLGGRFNDTWLPAPYASALHYREAMPFRLSPESGAARPVRCANLQLIERPRAYVHLPTASLQLIYDLRLDVPKEAKSLSLFHVDERLEGDQLVARLDRQRPDLYLMPLKDGRPLAELYTLKRDRLIPDVPVYLNSPMATDATALYQQYRSEHRLTAAECAAMCRGTHIVRTVDESRHLDQLREPAVIIAASGMATGGRVLHHLKALAPNPRNSILFSGFQAGGTRGADIVAGAHSVRLHGEDVPIRAQVHAMENLSAHADADEIMEWLRGFTRPPRQTYVIHGEPHAADTLRRRISLELGWQVCVPEYQETVAIDPVR